MLEKNTPENDLDECNIFFLMSVSVEYFKNMRKTHTPEENREFFHLFFLLSLLPSVSKWNQVTRNKV